MAAKNVKKDDIAPPLLLMPAGKGLTMNTSLDSFSSNVMLPVAQPESAIMTADVDAEVDSFVGQSPPRNASASDLFRKASDPDCPFSSLGPQSERSSRGSLNDLFGRSKSESPSVTNKAGAARNTPPGAGNYTPPLGAARSTPPGTSTAPPITSHKPLFQPSGIGVPLFGGSKPGQSQSATGMTPQLGGAIGTPATMPPHMGTGPPMATPPAGPSQSLNYHRPSSGPRYAAPTNLYTPSTFPAPAPFGSSSAQSPPVAEVSPMPNPNMTANTPYYTPPKSLTQPQYQNQSSSTFTMGADSSVNLSMSPGAQESGQYDYSNYQGGYSGSQYGYSGSSNQYGYSGNSESSSQAGTPSAPGTLYTPVQPHWFYCKIDNRAEWIPMTLIDSMRLEEAFTQYQHSGQTSPIAVEGGRYDVSLTSRNRQSVYWDEEPTEIRRCTWFFKNEGDNRFIPYDEEFAVKLEEEYRSALLNNVWHKRLEFPGGEMIVIHNPNVIVHFRPSSVPDEWGTTQGEQLRPRVVKRGVDEFDSIQDGEKDQVDHLILVVHGIGEFCDIKFRSLVQCVDDMRCNAYSLMESHFTSDLEAGRIGRVEFLPVHWHQALHGDNTGIDRNLRRITLKSIPKLRTYTNDTLLDILFYTSPKYCQTMITETCAEMNRLHDLFLSRNPGFKGGISCTGHSLGSAILFDLLCHQIDLIEPEPESVFETDTTEAEAEPEPELSLESLLEKLDLSEFSDKFESEKIDVKTLLMCSEDDIKEMGLPMGPRKKILSYLQEYKERKTREKVLAEKKALMAQDLVNGHAPSASSVFSDPLIPNASRSSVNYLCGMVGTGQPFVTYPKLSFQPVNFFALGSPIALFLSTRGITSIGDEYRLPGGCGIFNIFHPFDPVAYRLEPLIVDSFSNVKPVLIPHHKGRKRLHLELKESLAKVGADIKAKIMDSLRSTWNSLNEFARAHRTQEGDDQQQEVDDVLKQIASAADDDNMSVADSVTGEEEIEIGSLNGGRRVDYVLQEKPIESFNDYLFALSSHGCYWESEDTALLLLKETYSLLGVYPEKKGPSGSASYDPRAPPPTTGFHKQNPLGSKPYAPPPTGSSAPPPLHTVNQNGNQSNNQPAPPTFYNPSGFAGTSSQSQFASSQFAPPSQAYAPPSQTFTPTPPTSAPPTYNPAPPTFGAPPSVNPYGAAPQTNPAPPRLLGPPPMGGFMRKS